MRKSHNPKRHRSYYWHNLIHVDLLDCPYKSTFDTEDWILSD